jgi:hypothetical protein
VQIYNYCKEIIEARRDDDDIRVMRAHMFRVIACWPTWKGGSMYSEQHFIDSFHNMPTLLPCKDGPLVPRVYFFVSNATNKLPLCHWSEIYLQKSKHVGSQQMEDDYEHSTVTTTMHQKLFPFEGFFKEGTAETAPKVELKMPSEYRRKIGSTLTIHSTKGEKVYANALVRFYLGFSLHGPVAYIYEHEPECVPKISHICTN